MVIKNQSVASKEADASWLLESLHDAGFVTIPKTGGIFNFGRGGGNLPVFALASANPLAGTPHAA
jgi:hypothetical protein